MKPLIAIGLIALATVTAIRFGVPSWAKYVGGGAAIAAAAQIRRSASLHK